MPTLDKDLRRLLESVTEKARFVAEDAAAVALEKLAVHEKEPFGSMTEEQRAHRRALRALGRAQGDQRRKDGSQEMQHLQQYLAYEYWHRMIFARFLAENGLLVDDGGMEISMEECQDLIDEGAEQARDGFELACRYAAAQLPQIFRADDPGTALAFDRARSNDLKALLDSLPPNTFTASDALGWIYQFWQSAAKEAANQSGDKINADTLPAVTQLFTEPYMVDFLIHNTLGAWWLRRDRTLAAPQHAPTAEDFPYLRNPKTEAEGQEPTTNFQLPTTNFSAWPERAADLKILDPSMGSGHFLISLFPHLAKMRMAEEGLSREQAAKAVLAENLHGLELDPRCSEIAAFALALTAWKFAPELIAEELPPLRLACCGLRIKEPKEKWLQMATPDQAHLMEQLYDLFSEAPEIGSLINPSRQLQNNFALADAAHFDALLPALEQALKKERENGRFEESESGVTARGLAEAYRLLRGSYHLVITNVPYLARGKQDTTLRDHIEKYYEDAKADLATAFVQRCLEFCTPGGTTTLVTPQNWLFLTSYKHLRKSLLEQQSFDWIARLGEHGFQSSAAAGAFTALFSLTRRSPSEHSGYWGLDASADKSPDLKAQTLQNQALKSVPQLSQLENPDWRVMFGESSSVTMLNKYAYHNLGICTGDSIRFYRKHWEFGEVPAGWSTMQSTVDARAAFSGCESLVLWENGNGVLYNFVVEKLGKDQVGSWLRGKNAWGRQGVLISAMRELPATSYLGGLFDENAVVLVAEDETLVPALWCYCADPSYAVEVRKANQSLKVRGDLVKVPFDLEHWQKIAAEKYPDGLPEPYSNDPTQWLFKGRIDDTADANVLQVATARLLGHRWPAELDADKAGVKILDEDKAHWDKCAPHVDNDGIVCLHAENREATAAQRLRELLADTLGHYDEPALIKATGSSKKRFEDWLQDDYFEQHCKLFHHRPFIWHIWDGRSDGFHALVHYHQLDHKTLQRLTYTYLGDWILAQEKAAKDEVPGATERLGAARNLQQRLKDILKGDAPYDIFVRWKSLEQQATGWNPDLNDGVRMNIRPFMIKDLPEESGAKSKKGAGILRTKPNIKWTKDRGKDPASAPWFPTFKGDRINDHHLTLEEKSAVKID